ncbi:hypothetical protein AMS68_002167 [Peltaster fructicola]|uniref:Uncharacterized protein n=1 Tax=Peltaster fructicola TaxID=286661 RepID=A0A6H0XQ96_9PEZI|nr:hypothetical protein AMS68_002167 [Peltaster fructicola]
MTSPSVYLSFAYMSAAFNGTRVGNVYSSGVGLMVTLPPQSVSTLERMYFGDNGLASRFPEAAVTAMLAPDASDYSYWATRLWLSSATSSFNFTNALYPQYQTSRINFEDLNQPNPRAWYLRVATGYGTYPSVAPGLHCHTVGPHPQCSIIYDDLYQAQISVPSQIRSLDPMWASCRPNVRGSLDPPIALQGVDEPDAAITTTSQATTTTTTASPMNTPASPTVQATSIPVAQQDSLPSNSKQQDPVSASSKPPTDPSPASTKSLEQDPSKSSVQALQAQPVKSSINAQDLASQDPAIGGEAVLSSSTTNQVITFSTPTSQSSAANALDVLTQGQALVSAAQVAVVSVSSSSLTITSVSNNLVVGSTTISAGSVATVGGITISNGETPVIVQGSAPTTSTAAIVGVQIEGLAGSATTRMQAGDSSPTTDLATVGSEIIRPASSGVGVVIGSETFTQGQVTAIGSTTISVESNAVVVGSSTVILPSHVSQNSAIAIVDGQTIVLASSSAGVVVGSQTLTQGQATTIGNTVISVGPSVVVVGSSTIPLPTAASQTTALGTVAGQTIVLASSGAGVVIGTQTLSQGQVATISGTVISAGSTNIVVGSSTIALPQDTSSVIATVGGQTIEAASSGGKVVIGTQTLSQGQVTTIAGTIVSAGSTNLVIGSSTIPLPQSTPSVITTVGTQTIALASSGAGVVIGTQTLSQGQSTTISGVVVSVGSSSIVVGSSTIALPWVSALPITLASSVSVVGDELDVGSIRISLASTDLAAATSAGTHTIDVIQAEKPSITVGSAIITEDASSRFIIGSTTLIPQGSAVTIDGTTYSVGPSASYFVVDGKTSTIAPALRTTVIVYSIPARSSRLILSATRTLSTTSTPSTTSNQFFNGQAIVNAIADAIAPSASTQASLSNGQGIDSASITSPVPRLPNAAASLSIRHCVAACLAALAASLV